MLGETQKSKAVWGNGWHKDASIHETCFQSLTMPLPGSLSLLNLSFTPAKWAS